MNSMYPKKSNGKKASKTQSETAAAPSPRGRIQVRRSGVHGKGVFALQGDRRGRRRIIEYTGEVITWKEAQRRHPHDPDDPNHTFFFHIDDKRVIDGGTGGNRRRWINHSCDPNCEADEDEERPRLHQGPARHRAGRGAELRLRPGARGPADEEGEEAVRLPLRQPQVPRHHARTEGEVNTRRPAAVEIERVAETASTNADLLAWARAAPPTACSHRAPSSPSGRPPAEAASGEPGNRRRARRSPSRWPGRSPPASTSPGSRSRSASPSPRRSIRSPAPRFASA